MWLCPKCESINNDGETNCDVCNFLLTPEEEERIKTKAEEKTKKIEEEKKRQKELEDKDRLEKEKKRILEEKNIKKEEDRIRELKEKKAKDDEKAKKEMLKKARRPKRSVKIGSLIWIIIIALIVFFISLAIKHQKHDEVIQAFSYSAVSTKAYSNNYSSIKLSWDNMSLASGYEIYRSTTSNGEYSIITRTSDRTYMDTGLTPGATYYYKICGYYIDGRNTRNSQFSIVVSARPIPKSTIAKAVRVSSSKVKLSWTKVVGAHGYRIYRSKTLNGKYIRIFKIRY